MFLSNGYSVFFLRSSLIINWLIEAINSIFLDGISLFSILRSRGKSIEKYQKNKREKSVLLPTFTGIFSGFCWDSMVGARNYGLRCCFLLLELSMNIGFSSYNQIIDFYLETDFFVYDAFCQTFMWTKKILSTIFYTNLLQTFSIAIFFIRTIL